MLNDLPAQYRDEELDRNAFNAAFNELGLRWYWDAETHVELLRQSADATARIALLPRDAAAAPAARLRR